MNKKVSPNYRFANLIEIPIAHLAKAPWNYKDNDDFQSAQLQANLKRNGQLMNLIVRALPNGIFEVIDGNHRLDALQALQWEKAICYNLGPITENQAKRISIEINETRFTTNIVKISELIDSLKMDFSVEDLLTTLPFKTEELEAFAEMTKFDWDSSPSGLPDTSGGLANERVNMTFSLTKDQAKVVNEALIRIVVQMNIVGENRMSRALELVCADSLAAPLESVS